MSSCPLIWAHCACFVAREKSAWNSNYWKKHAPPSCSYIIFPEESSKLIAKQVKQIDSFSFSQICLDCFFLLLEKPLVTEVFWPFLEMHRSSLDRSSNGFSISTESTSRKGGAINNPLYGHMTRLCPYAKKNDSKWDRELPKSAKVYCNFFLKSYIYWEGNSWNVLLNR